jgi:hypothetical protein
MAPRSVSVLLSIVVVLAVAATGCGGENSPTNSDTTVSTAAEQPSTDATQPPADDSTGSATTVGSTGDASGSSSQVDPSTLLTDEDAAEYFGAPATHEGPSGLGNITYTPVDGTGQMIIVTTQARDTLESFEKQVEIENTVLGEQPQKIEGLGESAYFTISSVRFFKSGGTYQVTASNPNNGEDLMTALTALAKKMDARIP